MLVAPSPKSHSQEVIAPWELSVKVAVNGALPDSTSTEKEADGASAVLVAIVGAGGVGVGSKGIGVGVAVGSKGVGVVVGLMKASPLLLLAPGGTAGVKG